MPDLDAQIACVKREIGMRERVYPGLVDAKKMSSQKASTETATMRSVLATLEALKQLAAPGPLPPLEEFSAETRRPDSTG
jgi:hypothetical protein